MKNLVTALALTAGVLAFGATSASAAIVCNEQGDCWKTKEKYAYPPDARVRIYADDWKWGPNDKYRWREHEGRGYWGPNGVWLESKHTFRAGGAATAAPPRTQFA